MSEDLEHIKPFVKLTDSEKIERLHFLYGELRQEIQTMKKKVRQLGKHDHMDGMIVVPLGE